MTELLEIRGLRTEFPDRNGGPSIKACDDVDLTVKAGEIVGLVGESGCGKTTLGRSVVGLERPSAGTIRLNGVDLSSLRGSQGRLLRRRVQYIFQDAFAALSTRQTIGQAVEEALIIHGLRDAKARQERIKELLTDVGLPSEILGRYPRELSGGQRQRVVIARALAVEPEVLICDEPVSALDSSIRAQIMNLLLKLQAEKGLACLFISHDLSIVRQASQRVYVMYLGRIVEEGDSAELYAKPRHPYSQALLSALPSPDPRLERRRRRVILKGDLPNPAAPPSGCRFRTRCPAVQPICSKSVPVYMETTAGLCSCHYAPEIDIRKTFSVLAG